MQRYVKPMTLRIGVVLAATAGGLHPVAYGQSQPAAAPEAPADTAELRAQYEQ